MTRICIVVATFYQDLAAELVRGAVACLDGAKLEHDVIEVPGAFEIPAAIRMAIASKKYDGYVALGCVIRGETSHYDYVCAESARGLNELALSHMAPIGYGILTTETPEQAWERAAVTKGNKGAAAAEACAKLIVIKRQLGGA